MASSVPLVKQQLARLERRRTRPVPPRFAVLGIDGEAGRHRGCAQKLDHARRAADGVLVEVQAQLARAAPGRRRIGRHVQDGFARTQDIRSDFSHGFAHLHGAGVRFEAFGARQRSDGGRQIPQGLAAQFLHGDHLDEIGGGEPAAHARGPEVGSTWFGPEA